MRLHPHRAGLAAALSSTMLALMLAGCAPPVRERASAPAAPPAEFPEGHYLEAAARGRPVFRVDPAESLVVIEVRRAEGNHYVARGTLSLKGVKQPAEVPFTWTASADGATMEGELTLKRGAFGIGAGEWAATDVIGADVKVKFKVKLRKAG